MKPEDCSEEVPGFPQRICFNLLALCNNCVQIHSHESPFYSTRVIWLHDKKKDRLWQLELAVVCVEKKM